MKELMILHSPMVFLKSLQLHLLIKLEFGMQIIDKSYLEYKCLVYNAIAFSLCRMENRLFLDGLLWATATSYFAQSGKLLYVINDAHNHGCTAVSATSDGQRIISGGA